MLFDVIFGSGDIAFFDIIASIVSSLIVIFLTLPVHEYAHALVATKLGDPTPKFSGRLTVNPFRHIDYIGALCILFIGVGYALPVPINPRNFKNPKAGMALTALAGPISNIVLAFINLFVIYFIVWLYPAALINTVMSFIITVLELIAYINVSLAVFNLIPIPPLDGSRLLAVVLPDRIYYKLLQYEKYLYYIILAVILLSSVNNSNGGFLSIATAKIMNILSYIPRNIFF